MMANGHRADENHVSRTSSSCFKVNGRPLASTLARAFASSMFRPTTHLFPSADWLFYQNLKTIDIRIRLAYILLLSVDVHEVSRATVAPPQLPRYTPILDRLKPAVPVCFGLFGCYDQFACSRALISNAY